MPGCADEAADDASLSAMAGHLFQFAKRLVPPAGTD
jgi:hypothetical protein